MARRTRGEMGTQPYWRLGRGSNPLILSDFTDNPNSTARLKWHSRWESNPYLPDINPDVLSQLNYGVIRWTSGAIERRHSRAGNRTRTAKASPRTVRPPYWWRINDQLRPIRNWGGQTDLHRYQRRHGAQCCCYTMTTIEMGPLVGLAPTNTGLRNPPCSC